MKVRRTSKRVVLNRQTLSQIRLGNIDGMQAVGELIIQRAEPHVPDQPPVGKGLVESGRVVTFADGKVVAGSGRAPRGAKPGRGVVTIFGFGFPGRFLERGTEFITPRPYLTPATASGVGEAGPKIAEATRKRLR